MRKPESRTNDETRMTNTLVIRHSFGFLVSSFGISYTTGPMSKKPQPVPKNFEEALRELEQILSDIEGGDVGLEDSLVKYERGNFLIQHCRGILGSAEKQIEILTKQADGELKSEPLDDAGGK